MMRTATSHPSKQPTLLLALEIAGLLAFAAGFAHSPQRAWADLLLGSFYFVGLALFGTVFVALTYVFNSGWAVVFRRVPEAMSAALPLGAALMLALYFGRPELYSWARPEVVAQHPLLQHKAAYLNVPFFFLRMAVTFAVWITFSHLLRRHSRQQDLDGDPIHSRINQTYSAGFLILCTITFIFSSFDWIMSLEPEWYSTIFPVYLFSGLFVGGAAAMTILVICLQAQGLLTGVSTHHRDALGKILVAAGGFWAFVGFSQYMLIYYTNIPNEAVFYMERLAHGGRIIWMLAVVLSWLLPMLLLIPARCRRSHGCLLAACAMALAGHWLDLHFLIMPALGQPLAPQLSDVGIFLALLPLFVLPILGSFRKADPLPRRDPYLGESLAMHA
jgi:Ni/Fe-hydrogenase subunit HybB-like protein